MDYGGNGLGAPSKRGRTAVGVTRIGLPVGGLNFLVPVSSWVQSLLGLGLLTCYSDLLKKILLYVV